MSEQQLQHQIDRLYRRMMMVVAPVQITTTDDTGLIHRAQVGVKNTPEILDAVPVAHYYGFHANPPPQTDAIAIFGHGHRANPVLVGHNHQPSRPKDYKPGEVSLYSMFGSVFKLDKDNGATLTTKTANISGSTSVTLTTPDARVTDKLTLAHDPGAALEAATKQYVDNGDGHLVERLDALAAENDELRARLAILEARL